MRIRAMAGLVFAFLGASSAVAEPYLAAWKGVNCNACHVNQTGGWIRNDFGKNYENSLQTFDWQGLTKPQPLNHQTPTYVSVGVDLHMDYFYNGLFTTQYTSLAPLTLLPVTSSIRMGRESLSIYAHSNEAISGVVDYRLDPAKSEMYGLISQLPADGYLKIGAFNPAYGLGLSDDNSLVRGPLGFTYDKILNGIEAGFYPGDFFVNAGVFDDPSIEKIESAKGGFHFSDITLGGSFYGKDLDTSAYSTRYGGFGWVRFDPFVFLAEYDQGTDAGPTNQNTRAYHASLETDLGNDVFLRLASEYLDHSVKNGTEGFRDLVSLRCYPVRNLKTQVDLARMDYTSSASPNKGNPGYSVLLDTYFLY